MYYIWVCNLDISYGCDIWNCHEGFEYVDFIRVVYERYTCGVKRCRFHVADGYLEVSDCGSYMWDIHCGGISLPAMRDI